MRDDTLYSKILGCLVGGAIGDAFGIRVEMMHYLDIRDQYGWVTHFDALPPRKTTSQSPLERWYPFGSQMGNVDGFHPLGRWSPEVGVYTDDMRYRLLACHTILQKGGPINGMDFAETWLNYRLMAEGAEEYQPTLSWPGPQRAYARAVASLPWLAKLAHEARPCLSGWDAPIGIIHAGNPSAAAADGYAMAVAVATALTPGATFEDVVANVLDYAWALGDQAGEFQARTERLMEISGKCATPFDLYESFYREFLVTFPPWDLVFTLEMVPCALAVCAIAGGDTEQAIIGAANVGRDADTIACMAGELVGTLYGVKALPPSWVEKVLRLNPDPDLEHMAEDLTRLVYERSQAEKERSARLLSAGGG
ncbi:MAG: ADP-ribosylglycohydrolase family protein [Anaerolineae bacterium]|nr:ADP-ribosylglycohydrolase family protein [Anaerolineae bacterium]